MGGSIKIMIAHHKLDMKGGGERVILEIAKRYNPIIYTVKYDPIQTFPELKEFDIRVFKIPKSFGYLKFILGEESATSAISSYIYSTYKIKEDYDVINAHGTPSELIRLNNPRVLWYCHTPNRAAFDLYAARQAQRPLHKRAMMGLSIEIFKHFEYKAVPKIEKIVVNSKNTKGRVEKYLHRKDAEVIYPFADEEKFHEGPYEKYFFYPSRITPEKRQDLIINAFREFSKRNKEFKLIFAGFLSSSKRAYFEKLKELSKGLNVEFILSPSDEKMVELYSNAYAILFAAINEDFGLIPLEAGLSKKPIISVNEGGPKETVINGKTGFLVDVDAKAFSEKMLYLAERPEVVEEMGREAYKHIKANFSKRRFFEKFDRALREVARGI